MTARKRSTNGTKSVDNDPVSNALADLEKERKSLAEKRKELQRARRLLSRERFASLPRRGRIPPGELWTIEELQATLGQDDEKCRAIRGALEERGVPLDEWCKGSVLICTDLLIQAELEYMRCLVERNTCASGR